MEHRVDRTLTPSALYLKVPEALLSNFDLLVCDIALSTGVSIGLRIVRKPRSVSRLQSLRNQLAVAPVLLCLLSLSLELPSSWEHHVYHTSMM